MTPGRDDDALSWSGDDDPTLDVGVAAREKDAAEAPKVDSAETPTPDAGPAALPGGFTAVGKGSDEVGRIEADGSVTMPRDATPMANGTLIALGVIGGVYLIYAIGWVIGGLRLQGRADYLVADVMFQGSFWLAVLAPVLWFATVFLLTRASKAWVRIAWLVGGVLLLIPWPFIMTGAVGQ
ncbi:MAG: DNA polymerase III subunit gamma/tau [Microbacterium sp.]